MDQAKVTEQSSKRPITITLANYKGGVGKTTTAINLAHEAARQEMKILLIDVAPQANATISMTSIHIGDQRNHLVLYDYLAGEIEFQDLLQKVEFGEKNLDFIPSHRINSRVEREEPLTMIGKLRSLFAGKELGSYDLIIIDTDPSYGTLVAGVMSISDYVLTPLTPDAYSVAGSLHIIEEVKKCQTVFGQKKPEILGFFFTRFDERKRICKEIARQLWELYPALMMNSYIPETVRLAEAAAAKVPITVAYPTSAGAEAYRALWEEVKKRVR
jgi:chromosome partitioning protein